MTLTPEERATTINFDAANGEAEINTWDRTVITKLRKNKAAVVVEELQCDGAKGAVFSLPKELITFRNPRAPRAKRTDPNAAARMARARAAKGSE